MSDADNTNKPAPTLEERLTAVEAATVATNNENARLKEEITAMKSAKRGKVIPTRMTCNVCGDEIDETGCKKHPGEFVNHSGPSETGEETLVKQTRSN